MILQSDCLETLKCSICNRLLSVFPIYTMKNDQNKSICGRCHVSDEENYIKNDIYITLARSIQFPCMNREYGCMEDLLPENMEQHELICEYRLESCVFYKYLTCKWKGHFNQLLEHYKSEHQQLILEKNKFEIETNDYFNMNIIKYQSEWFLLEHGLNHKTKSLVCSIIPLGFGEKTIKYYAQIGLIGKLCRINYEFPEIDFNKNQPKSIDVNIGNVLKTDTVITMQIKITTDYEQLNLNYDTRLSTILKCSICKDYLYPPVYQCSSGHYACFLCKNKSCTNSHYYRECNIKSTINDLLNHIYYQCKHGCECLISATNFESHYYNCLYKFESCLLKDNGCKWQDRRKDIVQHIFNEHKDNTIENYTNLISVPINLKSIELIQILRFVKYSGNLFKLIIQFKNPQLLWRLEVVDFFDQSDNFVYEIIIFDKNKSKRLIFKESCADLRFIKEYKITDFPCVWLHLDQFNTFMIDNNLLFKINIYK